MLSSDRKSELKRMFYSFFYSLRKVLAISSAIYDAKMHNSRAIMQTNEIFECTSYMTY